VCWPRASQNYTQQRVYYTGENTNGHALRGNQGNVNGHVRGNRSINFHSRVAIGSRGGCPAMRFSALPAEPGARTHISLHISLVDHSPILGSCEALFVLSLVGSRGAGGRSVRFHDSRGARGHFISPPVHGIAGVHGSHEAGSSISHGICQNSLEVVRWCSTLVSTSVTSKNFTLNRQGLVPRILSTTFSRSLSSLGPSLGTGSNNPSSPRTF
jgi:hypothetical protein